MTPQAQNKPSQHASARVWDKMARKYAKSKIGDVEGYERSLATTRALLHKDQDVLEIGCGTGTTALHHAPDVARYVGTDVSSEMIKICNEKLAETDLSNTEFLVSPAGELPFTAEAFDVVMAHNILHLVDDVDQTLSAVYTVLRKDGIFISKTPCLGMMNIVMRVVIVPVMARVFGIRGVKTFTIDALAARMEAAGFVVETPQHHASKGKNMRPYIVARKA